MIKKGIKYKTAIAFVASFAICFSILNIVKVFATTESEMLSFAVSGEVSLDGSSDGQVTVSLTAAEAGKLYVAQGKFSTTETDDSDGYFSIDSLAPGSVINGYSLDASSTTGQFYYKYSTAGDGVNFAAGDHIYEMTYSVAAATPAGTYHLPISVDYVQQTSLDDYEEEVVVSAIVTVTRNDEPATKPSQVVTFRNGDGEAFTEITKHYDDDDFVVTKEVTTGDGTITEYHPDDDGSGLIAHTDPSSDDVSVGIPGDVEICAWVSETENYAATKACYTVHVQKRQLSITGATIADKTFDGTTTATVTSVSFSDRQLTSEQYTATASFEEADAGEETVHVSVELVGTALDYYELSASNYDATKTISPYHLIADYVTMVGSGTYAYDPDGVEPEILVTAPGVYGGTPTLVEGQDYDVVYTNNTSVTSNAHATVTGKGNYTTADVPVVLDFVIEARGINNSNLNAPNSIVEGHILEASDISVTVDGVTLTKCANNEDTNCDYVLEISGDNDGEVGHIVRVAVEGRNNYTGVAVKDNINIVAKLEQTVTIADVTNTTVNKTYGDSDFAYTATTDGDGTITYGSSDESVATVDNNGTVTIVGVGSTDITATATETDTYAEGTAKYTVSVSKKVLTVEGVTVADKIFSADTIATISDVTLSDSSLTYNTDYTATGFFNGVFVGEKSVNIIVTLTEEAYVYYCFTFEDSCIRSASTTSTGNIVAFTLNSGNTSAALSDNVFEYDGSVKEPTASVTVDLDGDGTKETALVADTDYEISYDKNINAGTATATITGKGNYAGSLPALEFTISQATVTDVTVVATSQTYTGSAIEPTLTVTGTVNGSSMTFTTDDYTIAAHEDFVNAGDHTVTINSKDGSNYNIPATSGTFTIDKAASGEPTDKPTDLAAEVGDTLADLGVLPEGYAWADPTTPITAGVNDYPATYTKDGDATNYTTVDVSISVLGYTGEYEVIKGDGQTHIIGVDGAAEFEIDADYADLFEEGGSVYVDNELLEPANYEAWSASTVISLSRDYLDSLAIGEHTLSVLFNDGGMARATFIIEEPEPEEEPDAANTGVFTTVAGGAVATALTAIVISSIIGVVFVLRKRNS